jgi:hypothetical protein
MVKSQTNKPVSTKSDHFVDLLDNVNGGDRKLMDISEIKSALESALGDRLEVAEEDTNQWIVSLKSQSGEGSDRICEIVVENTPEGGMMVSMNNKEIHFLKHYQKFISKIVGSNENQGDLSSYFEQQLGEFVGIYVNVLGKQMGVQAMSNFIKDEIFAPKGITLQENVVDKINGSSDATFIVLDSFDQSTEQIVTQVRVYRVNHLYNQVQINHHEREVELQVPRQMDDSHKGQLKKEITEILSNDVVNNTVGYKESIQILEDLLKENLNCADVTVHEEAGNTTTVDVSDESDCPFFGMSFLVTGFDYQYLQYMHLLLDNQYFQTEHLIAFTLEGDFKSNLMGVLSDMASNIQSVQKSSGNEQGDLTLENLTTAIEQTLGTEVERENLNEQEIVYKRDNERGKSVTAIRILVVPGDGQGTDLYRVFLFDPSKHKKGFHHTKSQHEYMMYASNGQEELKIFMSDLTKWKAKLQHKKLEKI